MTSVDKFRNYANLFNATMMSAANPNYFSPFQRPGDGAAGYRVFISGDVYAQSPALLAFS